jgi:N-acetylglucosaminyl-diphospho-decaprenol L-rhamnosyltransferase
MNLSVIILNCNEKQTLEKCLDVLLPVIGSAEIIVADNGSTDGSVEMVERRYKNAVLIKNDKNIGIAQARNKAIAQAKGDYLLSLDNDIVFVSGNISDAIDYMNTQNDISLMGFKLLDDNNKLQMSCRRFPLFVVPVISRLTALKKIPAFDNILRRHLMEEVKHDSIMDVDYVLGACHFIRKKDFELVGGYDGKIFFGPEDIDFALRLKKTGRRCVYYPGIVLQHTHRRRTRNYFDKAALLHFMGLVYFFWKHRYLWRAPA